MPQEAQHRYLEIVQEVNCSMIAGSKFEVLADHSEDSNIDAVDEIDDFGGVPVPSLPAGYIPAN